MSLNNYVGGLFYRQKHSRKSNF